MDEAAAGAELTVALVAEEAAGLRALKLLAERGQRIAAVLTGSEPVDVLAAEMDLERMALDRVEDQSLAAEIAAREVDLLLNVHSSLNPDPAVLAAPRIGAFNMHPAPLPAYPGFNTPSWSIAAGEDRHAVTVHWMTPEMDAGPVAYEAWFPIGPDDTGLRVATRCIQEGLPLLERLLGDAAHGAVPRREQPPERGVFHWYEVPHEGRLPWQTGARRVVDLVRAADYAPFPSPWGTFATAVGREDVEIVRLARTGEATTEPAGTIGEARGDAVPVSAGDEWVLVERCRSGGEVVAPARLLPERGHCDLPDI